jgi:hypothetical protein
MNVNSVTSLFPSYFQPSNSTANRTQNAGSTSSVQPQADVSGLSPAAQFLTQLQQLQTQSPQQFQAIISTITGQLQQAASTASSNGNSAQANQLTQLAKSFQGAPSGGALPTAQQLQQAGMIGHHHHGGGHHGGGSGGSKAVNAFQAANAADTQNQSLAASLFGSITPLPGAGL